MLCTATNTTLAIHRMGIRGDGPNGNVKEMHIHHIRRQSYEEIYKFDINGNCTERQKLIDGRAIQTSKHEYIYDSLKKVIKLSVYMDGEFKYSKEYKYNEKELMTESYINGFGMTKYKYDDNEKRIEKSCYSRHNKLFWTDTIKYDNNGNKIEEVEYNTDEKFESFGGFHHKTVYKYDEKGNLTEETKYLPNGDFEYKNTNKYDDNGNRIEETHYEPKNRYSGKEHYEKEVYKLDEKGNRIEITIYDSIDHIKKTVVKKYDDETGNVTEELHYYGNSPNAYKCVYEYDYYK